MRTHWVTGHDGVRLFVADTGPLGAQPLLLVHGWSQCHLSWERQLSGLAGRFRVVALDLRGHGASDKPLEAAAYARSEPWAEDIAAVIETLGLNAPLLAGWSMGGWIVGDYLRVHGDARLGAVALVGSRMACGDAMPRDMRFDPPEAVKAVGMYGNDLAANLRDTLGFLRACFAQQPEEDDLARMVGFNMLCPPDVRGWCRQRSEDYRGDFAKLKVPLALMHGTREKVIPIHAMEAGLHAAPVTEVIRFETAGHAPFWEDPEEFNHALEFFARQMDGVTA